MSKFDDRITGETRIIEANTLRYRIMFANNMKKIFTNPSVVPCDILKGIFEQQGLSVMIKNQQGSASSGVGYPVPGMPSAAFAWPEIWVNDEDFQRAHSILSEWQKNEDGIYEDWQCTHCGNEVNGELGVCWSCGTANNEN